MSLDNLTGGGRSELLKHANETKGTGKIALDQQTLALILHGHLTLTIESGSVEVTDLGRADAQSLKQGEGNV